tara:strand:+ start:549 stop:821 length:273 start_codon:yes stop_codon:yes gene_type:complete
MNFICIIKTNKMAKKKIKKVVKKVKENIDENRSLYNKILCYGKCYGGYLLAVGAGCLFGANIWWGLGLLVATGGWAYWATHCNNSAKCKR